MIYTGPSGTETTYYVGPQFEVVHTSSGTEYRHYISANGRPVMVIGRTTAYATNFRSLLLDHQDSISTIVNASNATSYATESFTAYGNRREASTWSGAPTSAERATMDGVTREGYTFQTVLGAMGLNHMNGRIEDSVTGRFLSPDPRGTIRGNTQSWNRYSYVNNNPLSYTDPTGFCTTSQPALKAAANFPCGGGGVSIPFGSVQGLSGFSEDPFGNLDNVGSDELQPIVPSVTTVLNPDGTAQSPGQASSAQSQGTTTAQSQTASDGLQEIVVSAQSQAQPPPALFGAGSMYFFAPSGFQFQAVQQAGRNFAAQGGKLSQLGPLLGRGGKYNLQVDSDLEGYGYTFYQDVANFDVGVFLNGYFDGSSIGYVEMLGVAEAYGAGLVNGVPSSNWSPAQAVQWAQWWTAGWNAAQSGNYPAQLGPPTQWPGANH
jgi:RHS repeat-associated protein